MTLKPSEDFRASFAADFGVDSAIISSCRSRQLPTAGSVEGVLSSEESARLSTKNHILPCFLISIPKADVEATGSSHTEACIGNMTYRRDSVGCRGEGSVPSAMWFRGSRYWFAHKYHLPFI